MIPVDQTYLVDTHPLIEGNCLQAAVASIYELPLDAVPHFILFGDFWFAAMAKYVESRGLSIEKVTESSDYVLAFGPSPRGVRHAVVWKDGKLAHDPHPSRDGLVGEPDEMWHIGV